MAALQAVVDMQFPDGRAYHADLRPLGHRDLMRALVAAIAGHATPSGGIASPASAGGYVDALRKFATHLSSRHPGADLGPLDLAAEDIDAFEERLRASYPTGSTVPYVSTNRVVFLLHLVGAAKALRPDLIARLRWGSNGPLGSTSPRDAYSGAVAAALRRAARTAMGETITRLTVTGTQMLARGRSPWEGSWARREDVLWEIARTGRVSQAELMAACQAQGTARPRWGLLELHNLLYPSNKDLAAFCVAFSLGSGLEIECVRGLKVGCLVNASRGYVEVLYTKNRRQGSPEGRLRVRDGNLTTPGGVLRALHTVTERARQALGDDTLWACYGHGRLHRSTITPWSVPSCPLKSFVARHDLRDDDGQPLHLMPARLRKTHKAERYRATDGRLDVFVTGNTKEVAARRYADIPALRETHEQAVADGLGAALSAVDAQPETFDAGRGGDRLGPLAATVSPEVPTGGETDVWLASCASFHASPFVPAGQPCPASPWACLECANATFDARKLPALLAFASWCEDQRSQLPAEVWAARLGRAYARVVHQVIPAFSQPAIAEASAVAGTNPLAAWLPIVSASGS
ncbi:MAG: hypothetical protein ACYDH5_15095 [Acidimicrobiales bacterium]